MDVLRPTLIRLGGRVYRKTHIQEQTNQNEEDDHFYAGITFIYRVQSLGSDKKKFK